MGFRQNRSNGKPAKIIYAHETTDDEQNTMNNSEKLDSKKHSFKEKFADASRKAYRVMKSPQRQYKQFKADNKASIEHLKKHPEEIFQRQLELNRRAIKGVLAVLCSCIFLALLIEIINIVNLVL